MALYLKDSGEFNLSRSRLWIRLLCFAVERRTQSARYQVEEQTATQEHLFSEIRTLCKNEELDKAMSTLSDIARHGLPPPGDIYFVLLQDFLQQKSLPHVITMYALMVLHQLDTSCFLGDYLVSTLAACGALDDALRTLRRLPHGSVYSWTSLIAGCVDCGRYQDGMHIFQGMLEDNVEPNAFTFVSLFKACSCMPNLFEGMLLHDEAQRKGLASDGHVGTALLGMYGKCGCIAEAENVFCSLKAPDIAAWNTLLSAYVQQCDGDKALRLYNQLQGEDVSTNIQTYLIALRACCACAEKEAGVLLGVQVCKLEALRKGRALHAEAEKKGFASDIYFGCALISMYGKCGSTTEAQEMFTSMAWHDVVSGSALLSAYLEQGQAETVLLLLRDMKEVDAQMFVVGLQACCLLAGEPEGPSRHSTKERSLDIGRAIHADCKKKGFSASIFVGSALIMLYGKCGTLTAAENVFAGLTQKDVVVYNAMLVAYVEQSEGERALQLYRWMQEDGVCPQDRTLVTALQACCVLVGKQVGRIMDWSLSKVVALDIGQALHKDAQKKTFMSDSFVGHTLINMYGTCGNIAEAENVFYGLLRYDSISWNAMLSAYVEQEQGDKVLQLYRQMQEKAANVDDTTLSYILQACCEGGSIDVCRQVHHAVAFARYDGILLLASSLIRAYASCANMIDAQSVFNGLDGPDVVVWTALIAGYAQNGDATTSLIKFKQMQSAGVKANGATLLSIISACSHANLVDTAIDYFYMLSRDDAITLVVEHYNSVLDLLGRAGDFTRVKDVISMMQVEPDIVTWLCLLNACLKHGNVELGKELYQKAIIVDPYHGTAYVLMSKIYTNAGFLEAAREVDNLRQKQVAWKYPGRSRHELELKLEQDVHTYVMQQNRARLRRERQVAYGDSCTRRHWRQERMKAVL